MFNFRNLASIVLSVATLAIFQTSPASAGRIVVCTADACARAPCQSKFIWKDTTHGIQITWTNNGVFRQLDADVVDTKARGTDEELSRLQTTLEQKYNGFVRGPNAAAEFEHAFDVDRATTDQRWTRLTKTLHTRCKAAERAAARDPLAAMGIVACTTASDCKKKSELVGLLAFCEASTSAGPSDIPTATISAMKATIAKIGNFDTEITAPDGSKVNRVTFYRDVARAGGGVAIRMTVQPNLEPQFAARVETSFRSDDKNDCDLFDEAAEDIMKDLKIPRK